MGCSMGGHLAGDLALHHPDEFRAVIGVEGALASKGVDPSRLAFYDPAMRYVIEPGSFTFHIGEREAIVVLDGDIVEHRQRDVVATEAVVAPPRRG